MPGRASCELCFYAGALLVNRLPFRANNKYQARVLEKVNQV